MNITELIKQELESKYPSLFQEAKERLKKGDKIGRDRK